MAGWSGIAVEEHARDCDETLGGNELLVNLKSGASSSFLFDNFLKEFLKEIGILDSVKFIPPMLGDGKSLNLLKLLLAVRVRGGNSVVSRNGLWNSVAEDLEVDSSFGPTLKLVYVKYLFELEKQLESLVVNKDLKQKLKNSGVCELLISPRDKLKGILSEMQKSKYSELESYCSPSMETDSVYGEQYSSYTDSARSIVDVVESRKSRTHPLKRIVIDSSVCGDTNNSKYVDESLPSGSTGSIKVGDEEDVKSVVVGTDGTDKGGVDESSDDMDLDQNVVEEPVPSRKRKRESICQMLNWLCSIARNPCDPTAEQLPEKSKWKSYGNEKLWKQVLLAREALLVKREITSSPASNGQESRKMHPCMYEDHIGTSYKFRERSKYKNDLTAGARVSKKAHGCRSFSSDTTQNETDSYAKGTFGGSDSSSKYSSFVQLPAENAIPVGPAFQAVVPEWTGSGMPSESETRWLGTRVWPPRSLPSKIIIEREPIGKGRDDSCGCEVPNSVECVRFHIKERRLKMKRELGKAFNDWSFDRMGEEVKVNWTEEEEKRFMAIVGGGVNLPSSATCFWDEIIKQFPRKKREDLVSYYYNVCLLCRRAYQNRFTPSAIRSDDDDSDEDVDECGSRVVKGSSRHHTSILGFAKKSRKKG